MSRDNSVPESAEGRQILLDRVAKARQDGNVEAVAKGLINLAYLVRNIGPTTEQPWYQEYMEYASEALRLLEGSPNKKLLASAHRAMCLNFVTPPEAIKFHLGEAARLSAECGDNEGLGFALYSQSSPVNSETFQGSDEILTQAEGAFQAINSLRGLALVKQRRGVQSRELSEREKADLLIEAADLFGRDESWQDASRALTMARTFGRGALTIEEEEDLLLRSLDFAQLSGIPRNVTNCYGQLATFYKRQRNHLRAQYYYDLEDSLDIAVYGSRLGRLRNDLEFLTEQAGMAGRSSKRKALRAQIKLIEQEIEEELRKQSESAP